MAVPSALKTLSHLTDWPNLLDYSRRTISIEENKLILFGFIKQGLVLHGAEFSSTHSVKSLIKTWWKVLPLSSDCCYSNYYIMLRQMQKAPASFFKRCRVVRWFPWLHFFSEIRRTPRINHLLEYDPPFPICCTVYPLSITKRAGEFHRDGNGITCHFELYFVRNASVVEFQWLKIYHNVVQS